MKWALVLALAAGLTVGGLRSVPAPALARSASSPGTTPSWRAPVASPPGTTLSLLAPVAWPPAAISLMSSAGPVASAAGSVAAPTLAGAASSSSRWGWPTAPPWTAIHPFAPASTRWGPGHRGVDLAVGVGGWIRAPADGQVAFTGMVAERPVLVIAHAGGLRSTFEPVVATVSVGERVQRGEIVGRLTEHPGHCAPTSCLHWGVLRGEVYLDPLSLISGRVVLLPLR